MLSFTEWLDTQVDRDDAVGLLAASCQADPGSAEAVTFSDVAKRMGEVHAPRSFWRALDQAEKEYRQQLPALVMVFPAQDA
jgi:hypothetical protein